MSNSTFFQKTTHILPSLKPYYQWDGFNGQEFVSSTNNIFTDLNKDGYAKGGKEIKATDPFTSQTVTVRGTKAIRAEKKPVKATWY